MTNLVGWVVELAHTHTRQLAMVAVAEGLSGTDALDAVQEAFHTFLGLPQARALAGEREDGLALMTVIVKNAARNLRRRHHRARPHHDLGELPPLAADQPSSEQLLLDAERHLALLGCVQQLANVQRRVVTLRMIEELSPAEVARELSLTPGHVAVLLHRAKKALLDCMTE